MNEIVPRESAKVPVTAGGAIMALVPQSLEEVFRLATAVSQAGMAPYGLETPQKVTIAILTGLELGLPPMQAIQSIAVINNRPCIWGDGLMAVVRKSPLCMYIREWIDGADDERVAYCETHRKGEDKPIVRTFSVADAKKAGLWQTEAQVTKNSKNGGSYTKDNDSPWYKYPQRMLAMRARAWCLRDAYADATKGLQAREEVEDHEMRDVTPRSSAAARPDISGLLSKALASTGFPRDRIDAETGEITTEAAQDVHETSGQSGAPPKPASPAGEGPASQDKASPTDMAEDLFGGPPRATPPGPGYIEPEDENQDTAADSSPAAARPPATSPTPVGGTGESVESPALSPDAPDETLQPLTPEQSGELRMKILKRLEMVETAEELAAWKNAIRADYKRLFPKDEKFVSSAYEKLRAKVEGPAA